MNALWQTNWFAWSLALILGFPTLVLLLGEVATFLERRDNPLSGPVTTVRNAVLPILALQIFLFNVLGNSDESIGARLFITIFWTVVIYASLSFLNVLLFEQAAENSWRAEVPTLFRDLSRFVLILVGIAVILSTVWSVDLAQLITVLGVGSLVIGLALQDTLSNLFSGIAILFEQPYTEGDWIEVDGTIGQVAAINWRATRITTRDGDTVAIPNSVIAGSKVLNESRPPGAGYEDFFVGFSYDDPPNKVKRILLDIVKNVEGVVDELPAMVRTISFDDSSVTYQVRFAIDDFSILPRIKDDLATRIWYAAKREHLTIPFPIRTLYSYDGERLDAEAEASELQRGVAQINAVLAPLGEDEAAASGVQLRHFGKGEIALAAGADAATLYTILVGEVGMHTSSPEPATVLSKGDLFGATSLLRGEPSAATFRALTDTVLVALPKAAVMNMVRRKPSFARELEDVIEAREQLLTLKSSPQSPLKP